MKRVLIVITSLVLLISCGKQSSITIEGVAGNTTHNKIFLNRVDVSRLISADSTDISKKGYFKMKINSEEPDFYQIGFSESNFVTLLAAPGEKIRLDFSSDNLFDNYEVEGSEGSRLVRELDMRFLKTRSSLDSIDAIFKQTSAQPGFENQLPKLQEAFIEVVRKQRKFNIEFIINNIHSLAIVKALFQKINDNTYVLYEPRDLQYLKIASDTLQKYFPESRHTKALVSNFETEMREYNARKLNMMIDSIPEAKLDPQLKDVKGRRISFSSLRGKYALLTFWSSDSRECVAENLQLKDFYRLYSRRGFEIYQISLDTNEEAWKSAVKFDALPWISVREDDPQNPKNALLFNVMSLPANYLFDPAGNIIGSNLHGKSLQLKLNQIFTN